MDRYRHVALLSPPYGTLTYKEPDWAPSSFWEEGVRVLVPLGAKNALRAGVVLGAAHEPDTSADGEIPEKTFDIKELFWPLERNPLLSPAYMEMVRQLALRQAATPGQVLAAVLPQGLRSASVKLRVFEGPVPKNMAPADLKGVPGDRLREIGALWRAGNVEVLEPGGGAQPADWIIVHKDPPWPVRASAKRQIALLEYVWDKRAVPRAVMARDLGPWAAQVAAELAKRELVRIGPAPDGFSGENGKNEENEYLESLGPGYKPAIGPAPVRWSRDFDLNDEQTAAVDALSQAMDRGGQTRLLYGVTGSGKTSVYLELARRCLESGRSVLLLAPEVALAARLRDEARVFFPGQRIFFHHGYLPPGRRHRAFREIASSRQPVLVCGTRSALLLPVADAGLLVLDEEHDASFKQDERFLYHAKEVAFFRAVHDGSLLVLGSATPDVKTYHAALSGAVPDVRLTHRAGPGELPDVRLVDIRADKPGPHMLAAESLAALRETVQRGEQAIILLNRRGYSPLMYCTDCGRTARCANCDIGLTYHKVRERLVCHYCGLSVPYPAPCAGCGSTRMLPMGEGTEKMEEALAAELGYDVDVLRMDRDTTRRPGRMEEILADFAARKAQVLVGTQMLSKGHHFPDVTLVVAADGDLGLNMPDYRATERTFQLLVQVAGRAGRGERPGRVLIQTRDPAHYCWRYVLGADYDGFYESEIAVREKRRYPPFVKLALIRMSFPLDWKGGMDSVNALTRAVRGHGKSLGLMVLGPAPAPLAMLRGRRRYLCLVKGDDWGAIRALYHAALGEMTSSSKLRLSLDLDPVNML